MIPLLLAFLMLASAHDLPRMSYLIVSSSFSKHDMEDIEDWKDHIDDLIDNCEDDHDNFTSGQREKCEDYIESISSIVLSNGKDINEKLAKVSQETDYLFYIAHTRHISVDFNNLPSKMVVYMLPFNFSEHKNIEDIGDLILKVIKKVIQSSFDGSPESSKRLSELVGYGENHQNVEVLIEGSISNKVSFLTISHLRVVYYHEFHCENVYLSSGVLVSMTNNKARVNNFIIDTETFSYYSILHYLETDQFTLVDFNEDNTSVPEYQIAYYDLFWGIQCFYDGKFVHNRYHWKVPYFVTKKFAIICHSYHVIIDAINTTLVQYPDVNITVTDNGLIESDSELSSTNKISIESRGFDEINKDIRPSVVVTYNKEKFTLDKSKSDLQISDEQIYSLDEDNHKKHKAKVGLIVGIVAAVLAVAVVVVVVVVIVLRKNKNDNSNKVYGKKLLDNEQNQLNDSSFHDPVATPNHQP